MIKFIDMEDFGGWDSGDFGPNLPKGGGLVLDIYYSRDIAFNIFIKLILLL